MTAPILAFRGVNKSFGPVHVLRGVDLSVYAGQVTALVGDNGAGKSTLVKVISGVIQPDSGTIEIEGRPTELFPSARSQAAASESACTMQ